MLLIKLLLLVEPGAPQSMFTYSFLSGYCLKHGLMVLFMSLLCGSRRLAIVFLDIQTGFLSDVLASNVFTLFLIWNYLPNAQSK